MAVGWPLIDEATDHWQHGLKSASVRDRGRGPALATLGQIGSGDAQRLVDARFIGNTPLASDSAARIGFLELPL
jgi:hypothetical protein